MLEGTHSWKTRLFVNSNYFQELETKYGYYEKNEEL